MPRVAHQLERWQEMCHLAPMLPKNGGAYRHLRTSPSGARAPPSRLEIFPLFADFLREKMWEKRDLAKEKDSDVDMYWKRPLGRDGAFLELFSSFFVCLFFGGCQLGSSEWRNVLIKKYYGMDINDVLFCAERDTVFKYMRRLKNHFIIRFLNYCVLLIWRLYC